MSWWQRFVWLAAGVVIVTSALGFIIIPTDVQVPRQFDANGWTSFSSRNVTLAGFILAAAFVAIVFHFLLEHAVGPRGLFLRLLALFVMPFIVGTTIAAVTYAS